MRRRRRPSQVSCEEEERVTLAGSSEPVPSATLPEGVALRAWLTMIGWQVDIEQDGEMYVGVARHLSAEGNTLAVGGCAASKAETVWQLFEAVMDRLGKADAGREIVRLRAGRAAA
jgi:hypothetical protein